MLRKFNIGDIVYKIESSVTGGAHIERHEVTRIGTYTAKEEILEQGELVKKDKVFNSIETDINGDNYFESEDYFYRLEEVKDHITKFLNRKKLW